MKVSDVDPAKAVGETKLHPQDWVLLPLLSVLTVALMMVSLEFLAKWTYPEAGSLFVGACMVRSPTGGLEGIPHSVCWEKGAEGKLTEYRFNNCGHRMDVDCGPEQPGTFRIVMTGSSYGFGYMVSKEDTFAALLPVDLSHRTGRAVDLYNVSMAGRFPPEADTLFHEVMAAKPDMVLWEIAPADIRNAIPEATAQDASPPGKRASSSDAASLQIVIQHMLSKSAPGLWRHAEGWQDHISIMLRGFLYRAESPDQYVASYLRNGDQDAGFLKSDLSHQWEERLKYFDGYAADMAAQTRAAGIPFVVVFLPNRAQAMMISMGDWPAGYDPYGMDKQLRSIIVSHGGVYLDLLPKFRAFASPERYYFPVDGHPTPQGHAVISELIAGALTSDDVLTLRSTSPTRVTWKQDK
jgi:hypothetical protein